MEWCDWDRQLCGPEMVAVGESSSPAAGVTITAIDSHCMSKKESRLTVNRSR